MFIFLPIDKVGNRLTGSVPSELGAISTLLDLNLGKSDSCVMCAFHVSNDMKLNDVCVY